MFGIRHKESMSIKLLRNTYSTQGKALSPPSFLPKGGTVLHNMAPRGCLRGVPQSEARASELPRLAVVAAVVPLLLLVVEFSTCVASCPRSMGDEIHAAVKQEAGPPPVMCVTPCLLGSFWLTSESLLYTIRPISE